MAKYTDQIITIMNDEELLILPQGPKRDDDVTILKPDGTKVVLAPEEEWIPGNATRSCTCGIEAIGGGIHSDYCDKADT